MTKENNEAISNAIREGLGRHFGVDPEYMAETLKKQQR